MALVKSYDYFDIDQCPKIGKFWSFKIRKAIKSRVLERFQTNFNTTFKLWRKIYWKIGHPMKKLLIFPIFTDFPIVRSKFPDWKIIENSWVICIQNALYHSFPQTPKSWTLPFLFLKYVDLKWPLNLTLFWPNIALIRNVWRHNWIIRTLKYNVTIDFNLNHPGVYFNQVLRS